MMSKASQLWSQVRDHERQLVLTRSFTMAMSKTQERRAMAEDRTGEAAAHAELHANRLLDIGDRAHPSWEISHVWAARPEDASDTELATSLGTLTVDVISASEILSADPLGLSDPYCEVLVDSRVHHNIDHWRTRALDNT